MTVTPARVYFCFFFVSTIGCEVGWLISPEFISGGVDSGGESFFFSSLCLCWHGLWMVVYMCSHGDVNTFSMYSMPLLAHLGGHIEVEGPK